MRMHIYAHVSALPEVKRRKHKTSRIPVTEQGLKPFGSYVEYRLRTLKWRPRKQHFL